MLLVNCVSFFINWLCLFFCKYGHLFCYWLLEVFFLILTPSMGFSRQEYRSGVPLPSPSSSIGVGKIFFFLQHWSHCLLGIITPMQFFLACLCILFLLVAGYASWPSFVSWFVDKGCLPCLIWSCQGLEDFHSIVSQTVVIETRLAQDALHWEDSITLETCILSSSP